MLCNSTEKGNGRLEAGIVEILRRWGISLGKPRDCPAARLEKT